MTRTRPSTGARRKSARPVTRTHRKPHPTPETTPLRELWLAGLGAAAKTGEAANGLVDLLVAKGREAEPRLEASANRAIAAARKNAVRAVDEVTAQAKLVVDGALHRFGVSARPRSKNVLHRLGDLAEAIL